MLITPSKAEASFDRFDVLMSELAAKLGVDLADVDPDKTFESYGLDSIDAVIVGSEVGERLGLELPPELFLQHRTVNEVLAALNRGFPLDVAGETRPGVARSRVFLCPGAWGYGYRDKEFTAHCAAACDLEHVTISGWRDWLSDGLRFETLIAEVIGQIASRSSKDSVRLAGYSQGGLLAFAVAAGLTAKGGSVSSLSILDSVADRSLQVTDNSYRHAYRKLGWSFLQALLSYATRALGPLAYKRPISGETRGRIFFLLHRRYAHNHSRWLSLLAVLAKRGGILFKGRGGVHLEKCIRLQLFSDMWSAWSADAPRLELKPDAVVLFRSEQPGPPDLGWSGLCPDLSIVQIGGEHDTIFDNEHVGDLVTHFITSLNKLAA